MNSKTKSRDITSFIVLRIARQDDERQIGDLLVKAFTQTYAQKLPQIATNTARRVELLDVGARRQDGMVYVLELGYRVIGTFSLVSPRSPSTQAWLPNAANLRCVALDPEFHGLRLSELMLDEAERVAKHWRVDAICLHVQHGAEGVARLYAGRGFLRDSLGDMESLGNTIEGYSLRYPGKESSLAPTRALASVPQPRAQ